MRKSQFHYYLLVLLLISNVLLAGTGKPAVEFTLSMERPNTHYFHVSVRCSGFNGQYQEFRMPVWTPGYYLLMDYPKNVINFKATSPSGNILTLEKFAKNGWKINTGGFTDFIIEYDVFAFARSVADSYLDEDQAFVSPTGIFIYPAGQKHLSPKVKIVPFSGWKKITTGLELLPNEPGAYTASDFDILYDSPILIGNQEVIAFDVKGVPHEFAGSFLGKVDRDALVSTLSKIIESSVSMMGDLPYKHYSFIVIGPGGGGLEHLNSQAITLSPGSLSTPASIKRLQSFLAHEYFHHYNVKRIRPIVLGPFDYDRENLTNMLWVSEGITVFYEAVVLYRAGLITQEEFLEHFRSNISRYENVPGRLHQSATESSYNTWLQFFSRNPNSSNTTISYYDKGAALGLLLDLKIRHETKGKKSFDDVMRFLYSQYYKKENRGFTDAEFREACGKICGTDPTEIFEYASTTKEIDYNKYLAYAGLEIDNNPKPVPGALLGARIQDQNGQAVVSSIEFNTPAYNSSLSIQDEIIAINETRVTARNFNELLNGFKGGDKINITVSRGGRIKEIAIELAPRFEKSFRISFTGNPTPEQQLIQDGIFKQ